jgi:hypothetical protein
MTKTTTIEIPEAGTGDEDGLNNNHANDGWVIINRYMDRTGSDKENALCDLLGDLMHYAHQNGDDFARELQRACDHFAAETANGAE